MQGPQNISWVDESAIQVGSLLLGPGALTWAWILAELDPLGPLVAA